MDWLGPNHQSWFWCDNEKILVNLPTTFWGLLGARKDVSANFVKPVTMIKTSYGKYFVPGKLFFVYDMILNLLQLDTVKEIPAYFLLLTQSEPPLEVLKDPQKAKCACFLRQR